MVARSHGVREAAGSSPVTPTIQKKSKVLTKIKNKPQITVYLIIGLLYLLTIKGLYGNLHPSGTDTTAITSHKPPFETSMERGRYAQIVSLAESKNFDVNEFKEFLKPDLAWYNNRFFSTFPPGVAVLALPFYITGKIFGMAQVFAFATSTFFSVLTAIIIYATCKKLNLSNSTGIFVATVFSLSSVAWPYSVSLSAHTVSAFITILGLYSLISVLRSDTNSKLHLAVIGFLTGLNFLIDYPNILIFFPISLTAFLYKIVHITSDKEEYVIEQNFLSKIPLILGFMLPITLFVAFNMHYFQKPIAFTNTYTIKFLEVEGINFNDIELSNKIFENRDYGNRFSIEQTIQGINTLVFSKDRGLLQFSPIFLLAIPGFIILFKKHKLLAVVGIFTFLLNVLIYGSYDDPWGGWAFGPRYLIVSLPILAVVCGIAFEYLSKRFGFLAKIAVFALLMASSIIALLGALTTNGVPPSIEVASLGIHSNYLYNWDYLNNNGVSSFLFGILFSKIISPNVYFYVLILFVGVFEVFVIFRKSNISK